MSLNDNKIKGLKPKEKLYRTADEKGLAIEVTPLGKKLWRYRFRLHGKAKMISLGEFPSVSLGKARQKRQEAEDLVKQGIHPTHHRQAKKKDTFQSIAQEFLDEKSKTWAPRTLQQRTTLFQSYIFPNIGERPITGISSADILHLLKNIEEKTPIQAYFARQVINAVFDKAICTLRAEHNPVNPLKKALKKHVTESHEPIPQDRISIFFKSLDEFAGYPTTKFAAELLWLTTVRTVELLGAKWDEFDLCKNIWIIPAERMKKRRDHVVPLTGRATEIVNSLKPLTGNSKYLFPNRDDFNKHSSKGLLWKFWNNIYNGEYSPHCVRASFSTWAHDSEFPSEVIETQLNHVDKNITRASYNRSIYLDKRREILQAWEDYLISLKKS